MKWTWKQVDMAIGVRSTRQALKDKIDRIQREFDLAEEYRRKHDKLFQVQRFDGYLGQISLRESIFLVDRNTISPHSTVFLEPLSKANKIESFVSGLGFPVHRYECPTQCEGASSTDFVIIPFFARRMTYSELVSLFKESKVKLEALGLNMITYSNYCSTFFRNLPTYELAISNRFTKLPEPEVRDRGSNEDLNDRDEILDDSHYEVVDTNGDFAEVNRSEKQMKKSEKHEQKLRWHYY